MMYRNPTYYKKEGTNDNKNQLMTVIVCIVDFRTHCLSMRIKILIIGVCLALAMTATAQNDTTTVKKKKERKIELYGEVYDSFTKAKIKAFITLMRPDSTVVDTTTCYTWSTSSYYGFKVPAVQADFIIKATAEGYNDTYLNYPLRHIARNSYFELPRILMKKKQDEIWREDDLEGVTVTGTRVKIAYRGDTIVYNAAAFNLPEGSMLDGLIRQMPGAELKDNGDIYINGKKVDYLTLNGKDFFKGQNKVMLDNLPYFTVRDIKVYNKSTKQSELVGRDVEKKDYVMDVSLKREYSRGYMGNIETGIGTDDRYMARLFGLYYSDHSRLSVFGNTNNINENRKPGSDGEWRPSEMPQGLRATKQTGISLNTEDEDKNWEEEMDATFSWNDADNWSRTATERFASDGHIFGGAESWSRQKDFNLNISNGLYVKKPFTMYTRGFLNYSNGDRHTSSQDSTWRQDIINRTINNGLNKYRTLSISGNVYLFHKFDWGDNVTLSLSGNYGKQKPSENFSLSNTYFAQSSTNDLRDYYNDTQQNGYQYNANLSYSLQLLNNWHLEPYVSYQQTWNNNHNQQYRLDWLEDAAKDSHEIGWLPSSRDQLAKAFDYDNSSHETRLERIYSGGLTLNHSDDSQYVELSLPLSYNNERMHYVAQPLDTMAHRHYTTFSPRVMFYQWGNKKGLQSASYNMNVSQPSFTSLMPHRNTTSTLATWENNPHLKARITHSFYLSFQFNNDSIRRFANIWTNASITQRSWGTLTTYNSETGAYTYKNDNIDGNWYWGLGSSYQQPIDHKKRLTAKQRADVEYTHSVDFPIQYITSLSGATDAAPKSTVNNWTLHERLELEYQKDKLTASVSGEVSWRSSTSKRENFERISAFDFNYGARLMYFIPWVKLSLGTDIKMFCRRGYNSSMMNTDDLVWNAELSRTLYKEKITLKLTAFDLLHQLSNKQYNVNAQGRTETWNNCIPRYIMLSCAYKLSRSPNK